MPLDLCLRAGPATWASGRRERSWSAPSLVSSSGDQGVDQRLGRGRHTQSDTVALGTPPSGDGITLALQPLPWRQTFEISRQSWSGKKRHHEPDRGAFTWQQAPVVHESPRGIAEGGADL